MSFARIRGLWAILEADRRLVCVCVGGVWPIAIRDGTAILWSAADRVPRVSPEEKHPSADRSGQIGGTGGTRSTPDRRPIAVIFRGTAPISDDPVSDEAGRPVPHRQARGSVG